jgi:hypothetical protein
MLVEHGGHGDPHVQQSSRTDASRSHARKKVQQQQK